MQPPPGLHHNHDFQPDQSGSERRTLAVVLLTAGMMAVEIAAGSIFGSMALLADGWHMGTHMFALGVAYMAYWYARRHRADPAFSFGTGKVGALGGYTSAVLLFVVALAMAFESVQRLIQPRPIRFGEAILVAVIGLAVNLLSARILGAEHHHDHNHDHDHNHGGHAHHDHNLRAAYLHVLADTLTSLLAIAALLAGRFFGWVWMDALMGIAGAVVISRWSIGLLKDTGQMLLDRSSPQRLASEIRRHLEQEAGVQVADLHLWEVSGRRYACIASLLVKNPRPPQDYKESLGRFRGLVHVTVEVNTAEPGASPCCASD